MVLPEGQPSRYRGVPPLPAASPHPRWRSDDRSTPSCGRRSTWRPIAAHQHARRCARRTGACHGSAIMRSVVRPDGTRGAEPIEIDKVPELAHLHGPKYLGPGDLGVRLANIPADALIVPWSEVERHKLSTTPCSMPLQGTDPHRWGASVRGGPPLPGGPRRDRSLRSEVA